MPSSYLERAWFFCILFLKFVRQGHSSMYCSVITPHYRGKLLLSTLSSSLWSMRFSRLAGETGSVPGPVWAPGTIPGPVWELGTVPSHPPRWFFPWPPVALLTRTHQLAPQQIYGVLLTYGFLLWYFALGTLDTSVSPDSRLHLFT